MKKILIKIIILILSVFLTVRADEKPPNDATSQSLDVKIEILESVSLMPGRPALLVTIKNRAKKDGQISYWEIHNPERYYKVIDVETGEEMPNFSTDKNLEKDDKFLILPAESTIRLVVSAPRNSVFNDPIGGTYFIENKALRSKTEPFQVDVNLTKWIISKDPEQKK